MREGVDAALARSVLLNYTPSIALCRGRACLVNFELTLRNWKCGRRRWNSILLNFTAVRRLLFRQPEPPSPPPRESVGFFHGLFDNLLYKFNHVFFFILSVSPHEQPRSVMWQCHLVSFEDADLKFVTIIIRDRDEPRYCSRGKTFVQCGSRTKWYRHAFIIHVLDISCTPIIPGISKSVEKLLNRLRSSTQYSSQIWLYCI